MRCGLPLRVLCECEYISYTCIGTDNQFASKSDKRAVLFSSYKNQGFLMSVYSNECMNTDTHIYIYILILERVWTHVTDIFITPVNYPQWRCLVMELELEFNDDIQIFDSANLLPYISFRAYGGTISSLGFYFA